VFAKNVFVSRKDLKAHVNIEDLLNDSTKVIIHQQAIWHTNLGGLFAK